MRRVAIGIERGAGLVHQEHRGLGGDGPGDAEPLLLTAGERQATVLQLVLDLVPQRRLPERLLDPLGHGTLEPVQPETERHVLEDAHRERIGLLEDHADVAPHRHRIDVPTVHVLAVEVDLSLEAESPDQIVHPVEGAQDRALAAPGGPDEAGDLPFLDLLRGCPGRRGSCRSRPGRACSRSRHRSTSARPSPAVARELVWAVGVIDPLPSAYARRWPTRRLTTLTIRTIRTRTSEAAHASSIWFSNGMPEKL